MRICKDKKLLRTLFILCSSVKVRKVLKGEEKNTFLISFSFLVTDLPLNLRYIFIHCLLHFKENEEKEERKTHNMPHWSQINFFYWVRFRREEAWRDAHIARRLFKFVRIPSKIFTQFALTFMSIHSMYFSPFLESRKCLLREDWENFRFDERKTWLEILNFSLSQALSLDTHFHIVAIGWKSRAWDKNNLGMDLVAMKLLSNEDTFSIY